MTPTGCSYDWAPGFVGKRLICVADHPHGERATVIVLRGSRAL
jgi:hypothetical protein